VDRLEQPRHIQHSCHHQCQNDFNSVDNQGDVEVGVAHRTGAKRPVIQIYLGIGTEAADDQHEQRNDYHKQ